MEDYTLLIENLKKLNKNNLIDLVVYYKHGCDFYNDIVDEDSANLYLLIDTIINAFDSISQLEPDDFTDGFCGGLLLSLFTIYNVFQEELE